MPRVVDTPPPRRPAYFWWLLANGLALCFAVLSWTACLRVFGHPEIPSHYEILRKIGRLPQLRSHDPGSLPQGQALDPRGLFAKYSALQGAPLERFNTLLLRNYLRNFESLQSLVYVEGDFRVEGVRRLAAGDFIPHGTVVRLHALVKPDEFSEPASFPLRVDFVLPSADPAAAQAFKPGDSFALRRVPACAAVVRVARAEGGGEDGLVLTAVPIARGELRAPDGSSVTLAAPAEINPGARFPIFEAVAP